MAHKYYNIVADIDGETETLFGSYSRDDVESEIDGERDSWRDDGYKRIRIVVEQVAAAPDRNVYPELYA